MDKNHLTPHTLLFLCLLFASYGFIQAQASQQRRSPHSSTSATAPSKPSFSPKSLMVTGTVLVDTSNSLSVYVPPATQMFSLNTVDGEVLSLVPSFTWTPSTKTLYYARPALRYSVGRRLLDAQLFQRYVYNADRTQYIELVGGRYTKQLNEHSSLREDLYSSYTLLVGDNYLKLFDKTYLELRHTTQLTKQLLVSAAWDWQDRRPLDNLSRYANEDFSSNTPDNVEFESTAFSRHQVSRFAVALKWQKKIAYAQRRGAYASTQVSPEVEVRYARAFPEVLSSDADYSTLSIQASGQLKSKNATTRSFFVRAGTMLSNKHSTFLDSKHFNGNRTLFGGDFTLGDFQLLDYYSFSTTNFYTQAHYQHLWDGWYSGDGQHLLRPVVSINYLYTETSGSYLELGLGLSKILTKWRVGAYVSAREFNYDRFGVRIGLDL